MKNEITHFDGDYTAELNFVQDDGECEFTSLIVAEGDISFYCPVCDEVVRAYVDGVLNEGSSTITVKDDSIVSQEFYNWFTSNLVTE